MGVDHPQTVKHHIAQLEKAGFLRLDQSNKVVSRVERNNDLNVDSLLVLPVMGFANCGSALSFAQDEVQGFLHISRRLIRNEGHAQFFILRATGDSMNRCDIEGLAIEDGDFLLIDGSYRVPTNGDYVVSIIDGCANVKRFLQKGSNIALVSESTKDYLPIFIHEGDSYHVAGKVVKVIKAPRF